MISCFKIGDTKTSDVKILSEIESTLELHALETADLIHQYYLERFRYQKEQATSRFGQLTISAQFTDSGLSVSIIYDHKRRVVGYTNLIDVLSYNSQEIYYFCHLLQFLQFTKLFIGFGI